MFIDNGFGGKDERKMTEYFENLVGGVSRAERLQRIWNNSYSFGTQSDMIVGRGKTKREVFESKALADGFTYEQIECFYEL